MRKLGAILLLTIILSAGFQDVIIYSNFIWNQSSIAQTLCVNQENSCCQGKCYLKQSIAENHEQNDEQPANLLERISLIFIVEDDNTLTEQIDKPISQKEEFSYLDSYSYALLFDIFHPPKHIL